MRGKRVSDDLCVVVYNLQDRGLSGRCIARDLGLCQRTVANIIGRRVINTHRQTKLKLGRRRQSTALQDLRNQRRFLRNPHDGLRNFVTANNIGVSYDTFRRRLLEKKIRRRVSVQDCLNNTQKQNRVQWCREHVHDNFRNWIFSDEMVVQLRRGRNTSKVYVYRRKEDRYRASCIFRVPYCVTPGSVTFWGCLSFGGFGICRTMINTTMNGARYLDTLKSYLLPSLPLIFDNFVFPESALDVVFQHDNARPHIYRDVKEWLLEQPFFTTPWPPYSPDLNCIEHIWAVMRKQLVRHVLTTPERLADTLQNIWNNLSPLHAVHLVEAMTKKCQDIIDKRGLRLC